MKKNKTFLILLAFFGLSINWAFGLDRLLLPDEPCQVNPKYSSLVTGCSGAWVVNMDGYVSISNNAGYNYHEVAQMVNTRLMATIREIGANRVELRVYVEGEVTMGGIMMDIIYNRDRLRSIANSGERIEDVSPTAWFNEYTDNHDWSATSFMDKGMGSPWNYQFWNKVLDNDGEYGYLHIEIDGGVGGALIGLGGHELQYLYTVYFEKKNDNVPLETMDLGFFASLPSQAPARNWSILTPGNNLILLGEYPHDWLGHQWIAIPTIFEYRYPSSATTNDPLMVNTTKAVLSGTFKQGNYPASNSLPMATYHPSYGAPYHLADFQIQNIGNASQDEILTYGFIYAATQWNPGDGDALLLNSTEEFEKEFMLSSLASAETYDVEYLMTHDEIVLDGRIFHIVKAPTAVGGDYTLEIPITESEIYSYWAFSINSYNGIEPFLNMGERKEFDPSIPCSTPPLDLGMPGDMCNGDAAIIINNYNDILAPGVIGGGTAMEKMYWISLEGDTTLIYNGILIERYPDPITEMSGGSYRVVATIPLNNTGTYCEVEETILITPCGGPFLLKQTVTPGLVCSGEEVTFTVTVENYGTVQRTNVIVQITPEWASNSWLDFKNFSVSSPGGGTYDPNTGKWTIPSIDVGPNGIKTLTLTYTTTNDGDTPFYTLLHYAEIIQFGSFVVPDDQIIHSYAYITVVPEPVADQIAYVYLCAGSTADPIKIDGVYTYFDYIISGTGTNLPNGVQMTQIPSFTADNVTAPITPIEVEVVPYYEYDGKVCTGNSMFFYINVYPHPPVTVPTNATYCDGETISINFPDINGTNGLPAYEYYWERIAGEDFGVTGNSGTNMLIGTAKNTGIAPLVALYQITAYSKEDGFKCSGKSDNFLITVNPIPEPAIVPTLTYIDEDKVFPYIFTSNIPDAILEWTVTPSIPDVPAYGYNIMPAFTATDPGNTYNGTVIATYSYSNKKCSSAPTNFTITIIAK